MYKQLILLCGLLFLGALPGMAQAVKKKPVTGNKSLLWKVSGKGLKQPSYLFGTLHIICPSDYLWTAAMQKALDASKKVVFEMDMDDPSLQSRMTAGMMLKDGKTLKDFYTEEEYKQLTGIATQNNIPLQMMQGFSPFALVSFLYLKAITCTIPESYEGNITKLAAKQHKEVLGLETVEDQVKVIEAINVDSIAKAVLRIAGDLDSFRLTYAQMLAVYKQQDMPALYQQIIESPDYKDDLNTLLFDRNKKWVPAIIDMAKAQPVFVAVGAGHLWGDKGVIALLRQEGYTVEPVR
ncbi:TraB/GumN family protein [Taibaiella koreensis]|uniref:TraB/GumN family protein n=1 Tax=Taibaiella koreensis TaxID=1268548 RepID=UPI0013C2FA8A|nr:TraB/GumN family protein [Taibaiella koreensis]